MKEIQCEVFQFMWYSHNWTLWSDENKEQILTLVGSSTDVYPRHANMVAEFCFSCGFRLVLDFIDPEGDLFLHSTAKNHTDRDRGYNLHSYAAAHSSRSEERMRM